MFVSAGTCLPNRCSETVVCLFSYCTMRYSLWPSTQQYLIIGIPHYSNTTRCIPLKFLLYSNNCTCYLFRGLCLATDLYVTILPRFMGDYRRGMDWWMDLLNTCTHHLELQVITALSLISKLYKSLAHAKYSQFDFTSRFLITDLNNEVSPASVLTPWLSGEYTATELTQPA
jgi:hypothetical protein